MRDHRCGKKILKANLNKPPKMTNSTSIDVNFESAWCNRVVAKQEDYHSTTPAEK